MGSLRKHRAAFGFLTSIALLVSTVVGAFACEAKSAGYQSQVYDSVLGWMTICAPSKIAGAAQLPGNHNSGNGHAHCAQMCAAHAPVVAATDQFEIQFIVFARAVEPSFVLAVANAESWPPGALGSRAPPVAL